MEAERDEKLKYKNHSCKTCGKSFFVRNKLIIHERVHTQEKPYSCDMCGKKFSDGSNLTKHKKIHSGLKPHECDICGKTFNKFNNLAQHKRIHAGEKPYACDICQRYFTASSNLYKHNKTPRHLNKMQSIEEDSSSNLTPFIDCGDLIKVEIKEEKSVEDTE